MKSSVARFILMSYVCIFALVSALLTSACGSSTQPETSPKTTGEAPVGFTLEVVASPGGTIAPAPGKYTIAEDQTIRLMAKADRDYVFDWWDGPLPADVDPYVTPTIEFTVSEDLKVGASWVHRPGMSAIDFLNDFPFFLKSIEEATPAEQYDLNGEFSYSTRDDVPVAGLIGKHHGNGMPDVAELYLLQVVLKSGRLGLTRHSGIASTEAWKAWEKNLGQVKQDLPGQDARVERVVAGYMTLGKYESTELIKELVAWKFGVKLSEEGYDTEMQKWLTFDEDADNDGTWNCDEWKFASPDGSLANVDKFAAAALDRKQPARR